MIDAAREARRDARRAGLRPRQRRLRGRRCSPRTATTTASSSTASTLTRIDDDGTTIASVTIDEDLNGNGKLDLIDRATARELDRRPPDALRLRWPQRLDAPDGRALRARHALHRLPLPAGRPRRRPRLQHELGQHRDRVRGLPRRRRPREPQDLGAQRRQRSAARARPRTCSRSSSEKAGAIIQRSRVTPGCSGWCRRRSTSTGRARRGGALENATSADAGQGSTFAGAPGPARALTDGEGRVRDVSLELGPQLHGLPRRTRTSVIRSASRSTPIRRRSTKTPHENEIWMSNANNAGHINFQLLGPDARAVRARRRRRRRSRVASRTFRSSMQAHVSVTDANGDTLRENLTFTTFQTVDGNSRPHERRDERCRDEPDDAAHRAARTRRAAARPATRWSTSQGRVRNEHILAETFGLGTGALPFIGDWGDRRGRRRPRALRVQAGDGDRGEPGTRRQVAAVPRHDRQRRPIAMLGDVEPIFDGSAPARSRRLNRATSSSSATSTPRPRASAVRSRRRCATSRSWRSNAAGAGGKLVISDITHARPSDAAGAASVAADTASTFTLGSAGGADGARAHRARRQRSVRLRRGRRLGRQRGAHRRRARQPA